MPQSLDSHHSLEDPPCICHSLTPLEWQMTLSTIASDVAKAPLLWVSSIQKIPAVLSFISFRQFKPAILAASSTDLLSESVKNEGIYAWQNHLYGQRNNTNKQTIGLVACTFVVYVQIKKALVKMYCCMIMKQGRLLTKISWWQD